MTNERAAAPGDNPAGWQDGIPQSLHREILRLSLVCDAYASELQSRAISVCGTRSRGGRRAKRIPVASAKRRSAIRDETLAEIRYNLSAAIRILVPLLEEAEAALHKQDQRDGVTGWPGDADMDSAGNN